MILYQIKRLSDSSINYQQFLWQTTLTVIGISFISYLIGTLLFRNLIAKPIQRIHQKAAQFSEGEENLGEQIPEPFGAELRDLTNTFNQMSQHLKGFKDEVEVKVSERTRLLEEGSRLVQEVLDTTPNLLCLMNTEIDQLNYVNREFADFFGVDGEKMIALGPVFIRGRIFPIDQDIFKHHEEKVLQAEDEDVTQTEFRMANSKGDWRWVSMRSVIFQRNRENKPKLVLHVGQDITDLKITEEKLRFLSIHDQLTGLYNRLYFEEEISRLEKGRVFPISTIMADLDNLKTINDTYGHAEGDEVLKAAAQILRSSFRGEDVVARIGGDEFAALLPGANEQAAEHILKRINENIHMHPLVNNRVTVSISFGYATVDRSGQLANAIKLADAQMYEAKLSKKKRNNSTSGKKLQKVVRIN